MREFFLCLAFLMSASLAGFSQPSEAISDENPIEPKNWKLQRGSKEFAFEFGFAPMQPTFFSGQKEYDTDGRNFALASFRFGRVMGTSKGITFEYLFEVVPVAFALRNEVRDPEVYDAKSDKKQYTRRENTFGAAIHPAGFRFVFLPKRRLKPYVQTSAGFIPSPCMS